MFPGTKSQLVTVDRSVNVCAQLQKRLHCSNVVGSDDIREYTLEGPIVGQHRSPKLGIETGAQRKVDLQERVEISVAEFAGIIAMALAVACACGGSQG
jgi:hypothetical protein